MRVDIWSDIVCPWCYVGKRRFETALAAFDAEPVEVVHHSFQLNPAAPRDATTDRRAMLMQKYRLTEARVDELDAQMTELAAAEGLQYHLGGTVTGNTLAKRTVTFPAQGQPRTMKGALYLHQRVIPNVYFHCTTAYNILRHNGVEVGKGDFLGPITEG